MVLPKPHSKTFPPLADPSSQPDTQTHSVGLSSGSPPSSFDGGDSISLSTSSITTTTIITPSSLRKGNDSESDDDDDDDTKGSDSANIKFRGVEEPTKSCKKETDAVDLSETIKIHISHGDLSLINRVERSINQLASDELLASKEVECSTKKNLSSGVFTLDSEFESKPQLHFEEFEDCYSCYDERYEFRGYTNGDKESATAEKTESTEEEKKTQALSSESDVICVSSADDISESNPKMLTIDFTAYVSPISEDDLYKSSHIGVQAGNGHCVISNLMVDMVGTSPEYNDPYSPCQSKELQDSMGAECMTVRKQAVLLKPKKIQILSWADDESEGSIATEHTAIEGVIQSISSSDQIANSFDEYSDRIDTLRRDYDQEVLNSELYIEKYPDNPEAKTFVKKFSNKIDSSENSYNKTCSNSLFGNSNQGFGNDKHENVSNDQNDNNPLTSNETSEIEASHMHTEDKTPMFEVRHQNGLVDLRPSRHFESRPVTRSPDLRNTKYQQTRHSRPPVANQFQQFKNSKFGNRSNSLERDPGRFRSSFFEGSYDDTDNFSIREKRSRSTDERHERDYDDEDDFSQFRDERASYNRPWNLYDRPRSRPLLDRNDLYLNSHGFHRTNRFVNDDFLNFPGRHMSLRHQWHDRLQDERYPTDNFYRFQGSYDEPSKYHGRSLRSDDNYSSSYSGRQISENFAEDSENDKARVPTSQHSTIMDGSYANFQRDLSQDFPDLRFTRFSDDRSTRFVNDRHSRFANYRRPPRFINDHPSRIADNQSTRFVDSRTTRYADDRPSRFIDDRPTSRFRDADDNPSRFTHDRPSRSLRSGRLLKSDDESHKTSHERKSQYSNHKSDFNNSRESHEGRSGKRTSGRRYCSSIEPPAPLSFLMGGCGGTHCCQHKVALHQHRSAYLCTAFSPACFVIQKVCHKVMLFLIFGMLILVIFLFVSQTCIHSHTYKHMVVFCFII